MVTIVYILTTFFDFKRPRISLLLSPELLALLGSDYPVTLFILAIWFTWEKRARKTGEPGVAKYGIGIGL